MSGSTKSLSINFLRNFVSSWNSTTFAQDSFGFNLSSDFIPIETSALTNAGLSLSESPRYIIVCGPLLIPSIVESSEMK